MTITIITAIIIGTLVKTTSANIGPMSCITIEHVMQTVDA
jgi:hypothetical protein